MTAGELRESIRFERRRIGSDDGAGNVEYEWQTLTGPVPARITPAGGTEEVLADRLTGLSPVEIIIRSSVNTRQIMTSDRAVDCRRGHTFNIIGVSNNDERNFYLNILARAGEADG